MRSQLPLEDAEGGVGGVDGVGSGVGDVGSRGDDVGVGGVESGSAIERVTAIGRPSKLLSITRCVCTHPYSEGR